MAALIARVPVVGVTVTVVPLAVADALDQVLLANAVA